MAKKKKQEKLTFEQALGLGANRLSIGNGQLGLSESLECYQQGVGLLKHCHDIRIGRTKNRIADGVDAKGML